MLGLKAGKAGRSRLSGAERLAWLACIALSAVGLILFLIFIIWYGADPEGAKTQLIAFYHKVLPEALKDDALPSPSPSPVVVTPAVSFCLC